MKKPLEKVANGVREGRHSESGDQEGPPRPNVVRLPRDWLGPREDLVPFGPRASSEDAEEPPPSADDFWGERSAAIHDALEAPADASGGPVGAQTRRRFDRRPRATAVGVLAIALLVAIGFVSSVSGPGPGRPGAAGRAAGGSKVGVAAVFGSGVSRLLHLGLARLDASVPRNLGTRTPSKTFRRAAVRNAPHRVPAARARDRSHPPLSSAQPASIDTAHVTTGNSSTYAATNHVDTAPTYRSAPPRPPSQPDASSATVSPTGQSGALGPIQSPNG